MESIRLKVKSNSELWALIDRKADHILIQQFSPAEEDSWNRISIEIDEGFHMKDAKIRDLRFDLSCGPYALKRILELNTPRLEIYQFSSAIPDTLGSAAGIEELQAAGLEHLITIDRGSVHIRSFNADYLQSVRAHPEFADKIE
jgi:hypothetical protein